jgi:hypothetical protein
LSLDILRQRFPNLLDVGAVMAGNKANQFLQAGGTEDGVPGRA